MGALCSTGGSEDKEKLCAPCVEAGKEFEKEYDRFRKEDNRRPAAPKVKGASRAAGVFVGLLKKVRKDNANREPAAAVSAPGGALGTSLVPALFMRS
jgi:hypothetical protein